MRTIKTVCDGRNENIIRVINLGVFRFSPYYFVDMELCAFSLHDFIHSTSNIDSRGMAHIAAINSTFSRSKSVGVWNIMRQVACGIEFIHGQPEIHRNLTTSNSKKSKCSWQITISPVRIFRIRLESVRLWNRLRSHREPNVGAESYEIIERLSGSRMVFSGAVDKQGRRLGNGTSAIWTGG